MIKVLVVDDSAVAREFLTHLLNSDPEMEVIGTAGDGREALAAVREKRPDVITMDIRMPNMDGFDATRQIMESHPTPIVIVSGYLAAEEAASFKAIEVGALAVLARPAGFGHPDHSAMARELVQTVKLMSEVKVVRRRWPPAGRTEPTRNAPPKQAFASLRPDADLRLVAIGTSTGGPIVLNTILSNLPKDFSIPILIVQHIAAGFVHGFTEWLTFSSGFTAHVAVHGERFLPGHAYVAPDNFHLEVSAEGRMQLRDHEPINNLRPSVSALFQSVAEIFGRQAIGVLLTGMGRDGADELLLMKEKGAVTIAQDEETSIIHGMPGEAIRLGAANHILSPMGIASLLVRLAIDTSHLEKAT